jgi:NADH-quinone oxidoreductase subunit C
MTAEQQQIVSPKVQALADALTEALGDRLTHCDVQLNEVTIECSSDKLLEVAGILCNDRQFLFKQLVDLCGVDYSEYGKVEWTTYRATGTGFSRGVDDSESPEARWEGKRYAVVIHLLSHRHNQRLRLRCYAEGEPPMIPSVIDVWAAANWFEREAFDLYGIIFDGHPDLRRILTDYGFIGHPFRKDFPLIGNVEMRFDTEKKRVVYQPVSIESRVLVPRVIRHDSRYTEGVVPVKPEENNEEQA